MYIFLVLPLKFTKIWEHFYTSFRWQPSWIECVIIRLATCVIIFVLMPFTRDSYIVFTFQTVLPAAATDVYYRDEIGNISTSHMRVLSDSVELDLRPRFPLFGGWKTHYVLGYNVPSYEYLFYSGTLK